MDPFGIYGQGHIHPVINDQGYMIFPGDGMYLFGQSNVLSGVPLLLPELEQGGSTLESLFHPTEEFLLLIAGAVGDKI
jgi:hypothetical protein